MIAGRLTMRAEIERNTASGTDAWGGAVAPSFTALHADLPCFVWSRQSRELVDGRKNAMIEDLRAMFALGADVREADEIVAVSDRAGNVLIEGRLKIEGAPQFKHSHIEVALQRIG